MKKVKKIIITSCLVLNSSRSGYRTIIKNLVEDSYKNKSSNYKNIYVFQETGWKSLELDYPINIWHDSFKIVVINSFNSKWMRGICEQFLIPYLSILYSCDFIFMPSTFGLFIPIKKVITFVHTNTSFKMDRNLRGRSNLQQLAHNIHIKITSLTSSILLFTSETTKKEYIKFNKNALYKKSFVIGNGLNIERYKSGNLQPVEFLKNKKFLLSVSQIYRLKNFDSLIKAFLKVSSNNSIFNDIFLVIVGTIQEYEYFNELKTLAQSSKNIIFLHNLLDEEMNWLYRNCDTYIFLSLFEGYSLTPAEAICSGKDVIISDIEVHREIYKNVANFVNPLSINSISKIIKSRTDENYKIDNIKKKNFINSFSLEKFITNLYKIILNA